jgi:hypothetical protein
MTVKDERLWQGDQALYGSLIVYHLATLYRARIKRDAYDNQCTATVEMWYEGWKEIQSVPIKDLPIVEHSYISTDWRKVMSNSLKSMCQLGVNIMGDSQDG